MPFKGVLASGRGLWRWVRSDELLLFQCLHHAFRHGLVVFLGVANVGEDLRESLFVVNLAEVFVLLQPLFVGIQAVDVGLGVVVVSLAVYESLGRKPVGERRVFPLLVWQRASPVPAASGRR